MYKYNISRIKKMVNEVLLYVKIECYLLLASVTNVCVQIMLEVNDRISISMYLI